jgi:excisionase family DNA binding protein
MDEVEPMLLRAEEAALLLGIGRTKVCEMLATGDLPAIRIGRCVRISRDQLEGWIDEQLERNGFIRLSKADEPRRPGARS